MTDRKMKTNQRKQFVCANLGELCNPSPGVRESGKNKVNLIAKIKRKDGDGAPGSKQCSGDGTG